MTTRAGAPRAQDRMAEFADALEDSRARETREYVFEIEFYCDATGCRARTITVRIKELDGPRPVTRAPRCPLCGAPLKTHHVLTLGEAEADRAREARCSVNVQRYMVRERARAGQAPLGVPLAVFLDDSLPCG